MTRLKTAIEHLRDALFAHHDARDALFAHHDARDETEAKAAADHLCTCAAAVLDALERETAEGREVLWDHAAGMTGAEVFEALRRRMPEWIIDLVRATGERKIDLLGGAWTICACETLRRGRPAREHEGHCPVVGLAEACDRGEHTWHQRRCLHCGMSEGGLRLDAERVRAGIVTPEEVRYDLQINEQGHPRTVTDQEKLRRDILGPHLDGAR